MKVKVTRQEIINDCKEINEGEVLKITQLSGLAMYVGRIYNSDSYYVSAYISHEWLMHKNTSKQIYPRKEMIEQVERYLNHVENVRKERLQKAENHYESLKKNLETMHPSLRPHAEMQILEYEKTIGAINE